MESNRTFSAAIIPANPRNTQHIPLGVLTSLNVRQRFSLHVDRAPRDGNSMGLRFIPTSTICASPAALKCVNSFTISLQ